MVANRNLTPDCAIWAFSKEACDSYERGAIDRDDLRIAWNRLHGELLDIKGDDAIVHSLNEITRLYQQHKDDNATTTRPLEAETSANNTKRQGKDK